MLVLRGTVPAYGQADTAQAKPADHATVSDILQRAYRSALAMEVGKEREENLESIARLQGAIGEIKAALQTLTTMKIAIDKVSVLYGIALMQAEAGKRDSATDLI